MQTYNYPFDEEKAQSTKEALHNYFQLQKLEYIADEIHGENGWSWIAVIGEGKKKNGKLKNYLTTVAISKLSDTQIQVSVGTKIKASDIFVKIGAGAGWFLVSPLGPLISLGIIGGVFATISLTSKRRQAEKTIGDIVKMHLGGPK